VLYRTLLHWLPPLPTLPAGEPAPPLEGAAPSASPAGNRPAAASPDEALAPDLPAPLRSVPGLALDAALRNVLGRPQRLMTLLHRFGLEHGADAEAIQALLLNHDLDGARRMAHTLKGLAGTLGLSVVQNLAAALEQELKRHLAAAHQEAAPPDTDTGMPSNLPELAELAAQMSRLLPWLQALGPLSDGPAAHSAEATLGPQALAAPLQALRELLLTDDVRAPAAFAALERDLHAVHPVATEQIGRQLADYALDQALLTLDALLAAVPALQAG